MKYSFLFVNFLGITLWGVSGVIESNTTWTKANSPYVVTGNVGIPEGIRLTIEPGVEVRFEGAYEILVNGSVDANGTTSEPIVFGSTTLGTSSGATMLFFKKADLNETILNHVSFLDASKAIRVGNTDTDNNTGNLRGSNLFLNRASILTDGADSGSRVIIRNSEVNATTIKGNYPRSEVIEIHDSNLSNTTLASDSYHNGFIITNSNFDNIQATMGCCGANFRMENIRGKNLTVREGGGSPVSGEFYIENSIIERFSLVLNSAKVTVRNSILTQDSTESLIAMGNGSVFQSYLLGKGTGYLLKVSGRAGYNIGGSVSITQSLFENASKAISISGASQSFSIASNNFLGIEDYAIENLSAVDVVGNGNFYGANDSQAVNSQIYDYYDNLNKGKVLRADEFSSQLIIDPKTPISSPKSVEKIGVAGGVKLTWEANAESDVTGYRIHYGSSSDYAYTSVANIGNQQTHTITGASLDDEISVTAYDSGASNLSDINSVTGNQLNLSESWFSKAVTKGYFIQPAAGSGGTVTGSDTYEDGDTATFTANASNGYKFLKWVVGQSEYQTSTIQLVINGPLQINAIFEKDLNDNDQDGISNYDEIVTYQTNPNESDTDNDSLSDGDELNLGTDPKVADTKIVNFFEQIALSREQDSRNKGYQEGYDKGFQDGNASGVSYVIGSPNEFSLFTEDEMVGWMELSYDLGVLDGNESGIDHVLKNPQRYNLFKEHFITDSIESSRSVYELKARKEGEQTVLDNPGLFGLKLLDEEFKVTPYTKSWFFDEHLGWLWTNHQVFPYIYKAEKKSEPSAWLFFEQASYPPKFYNYETKEWFELNE